MLTKQRYTGRIAVALNLFRPVGVQALACRSKPVPSLNSANWATRAFQRAAATTDFATFQDFVAMGRMNSQNLIVFVKAPRPGAVKTRLAKVIGTIAACDAYRVLVETLLNELSEMADVELRFTPDDAGDEVKSWLRNNWQMRSQGQGSLGERMQAAFAGAFRRGAQRVAIIGSDCPSIATRDIEAAWDGLRLNDIVIGPARDGGYWLIGLRQSRPELFDGITWSTATVLRETLTRAEAAGLRVKLLEEKTDVDTEAEWRDLLLDDERA